MKRLDGYIYRYINHEISIDDIAMVLSTMSEKVQEKFSDRLNYLTNKRLKDNE